MSDNDYTTGILTQIANKVDKETGKGLSSNDYTTTEKNKLAGIATGATAVTESTVSGWGFTKNTGTLTSETDPVFTASAAYGITSTDISNWNAKQNALTFNTDPSSSNKVATMADLTKSNVGLDNVENKSSATIRGELTKSDVANALGYTPPKSGTVSVSLGEVLTGFTISDGVWAVDAITLNKGAVGLENVDNTADANKSVAYATSAGSAPASDVYSWAKESTKPSYTLDEVTDGSTRKLPTTMVASGSNHAGGLVPDTPSDAGTTKFLREDGSWQVPAYPAAQV